MQNLYLDNPQYPKLYYTLFSIWKIKIGEEVLMTGGDAYTALADKHGFKDSARYRKVLEFLMTPRQAQMVVSLPKSFNDLAKDFNINVETVKKELDNLFLKGVIFPKDFETREGYRFARSVTQLHDASQSIMRPLNRQIYSEAKEKEFFQLWEDFCRKDWEPQKMAKIAAKTDVPAERIIPAFLAIKDIPGVLPHENIRELLKHQQSIAMVSCSCRRRKEIVTKHCDRSHDENCIQFNRGAEYALKRGSGKQLSLNEAIELYDQIEKDGLVHVWRNTSAMSQTVMCNCCPDCCMNLLPMSEYNVPPVKYYAKSRFEARVNQDLCKGCQDCIEKCPFNAISLEKPAGSKKFKALVDPEKCMGCGVCVLACANDSLGMVVVRPPEHIPSAAE